MCFVLWSLASFEKIFKILIVKYTYITYKNSVPVIKKRCISVMTTTRIMRLNIIHISYWVLYEPPPCFCNHTWIIIFSIRTTLFILRIIQKSCWSVHENMRESYWSLYEPPFYSLNHTWIIMVSIRTTCLFLASYINITGFYTNHLLILIIIRKSYWSLYEPSFYSLNHTYIIMVSKRTTCLFLDSYINITGFYTNHLQVFVIIRKSYWSLYETPALSLTRTPFDHTVCLQVPHKSQHTVKISLIALTG
jgi:hypothetical protein